jgi:hypothetical protein
MVRPVDGKAVDETEDELIRARTDSVAHLSGW